MADVFRLANKDQTSTVNLLSGTLKLKEGSWHTMAASPKMSYATGRFGGPGRFVGYDKVVESFSLVADDTVSNVITAIIALEDVAQEVRAAQDGNWDYDTWWLEWNVDGESARRALIHSITLSYPASVPGVTSFIELDALEVRVVLERAPLWESTAYGLVVAGSALSTEGGYFRIGDIPGTELARMERCQLYISVGGGPYAEFWVGLRPYHSGLGDFDPVWECEDWTIDDSDDTTDEGTYIRVDFANDATLIKRVHEDVDGQNSGSDDEDFMGRYLVLARCRVTAGTCGLQMRSGYNDNIVHEEVYVDNTDWYLRPLGQIAIPGWPQREFAGANACSNFTISLYAEQVSDDAGSLDVDCLITIPSEHMVYVSEATASGSGGVTVYTTDDDQLLAVQYVAMGGLTEDNLPPAQANWYMPLNGCTCVVAAQDADEHVAESTITPHIRYYPRWRSYRGDAAST